jgi:Eukaryotic membrane protein family
VDILKGLLIVLTYYCMTFFDASKYYHNIRGQNTIKLYMLFNVLDVDSLCE